MPKTGEEMSEAQANLTERELEVLFLPPDSGKLPRPLIDRPLIYPSNPKHKPRQPARGGWYQTIDPVEDLESEFLRRIS